MSALVFGRRLPFFLLTIMISILIWNLVSSLFFFLSWLVRFDEDSEKCANACPSHLKSIIGYHWKNTNNNNQNNNPLERAVCRLDKATDCVRSDVENENSNIIRKWEFVVERACASAEQSMKNKI